MLNYLIFDVHGSTEDVSSFEAMATASEARWPALQAEIETVLAWCHQWGEAHRAPVPRALDDGGGWDFELSVLREQSDAMAVGFDPHRGVLTLEPGGAALTRFSVTLVLSGREAFAADFSARYLPD